MLKPCMRRLFSASLPALLLAALLSACGRGQIDTNQVKDRMLERKLFHITDVELNAGAEAAGHNAARLLDSAQTTAGGDTANTCLKALAPTLKRLEQEGITATRLTWDNWHPQPDVPKVNEVLEALKYTHSQGQPIPSNLQKDGQKGYHYVEGLTVRSKACLSCHPSWKQGEEVGVFSLRYGSKPAVKEASKGKKGM